MGHVFPVPAREALLKKIFAHLQTSEVATDDQARPADRSERLAGQDSRSIETSEVSPLALERAIADAAQELVQLREAWLNPASAGEAELKKRTLTNLYNQRPTWLDNAHRKLDEAVFAAYGWPSDLSDDEILARLLALNLQRATSVIPAVVGGNPGV
jgi:hypothetical protein